MKRDLQLIGDAGRALIEIEKQGYSCHADFLDWIASAEREFGRSTWSHQTQPVWSPVFLREAISFWEWYSGKGNAAASTEASNAAPAQKWSAG